MCSQARTATSKASLQDKVQFLRQPGVYPERTSSVEVRETHLSYVFLTSDSAYKMKKPLAHALADLRTLEGRGANCQAEVQLNRRLAPDVYLGITALTQSASGALSLGGEGEVVEWLVRMRRLPSEAMLDQLIVKGRLRSTDVVAVAERLGEFFSAQPGVDLSAEDYVAQLRHQLELSVQMLARREFGLSSATLGAVAAAVRRYLDEGTELAARARRIVEGHGDLRPEHVCVVTPPVVIDCLEFSRELRLLDPFDEIAFLGLECARLGADWVGPLLRHSLEAILQDVPPPRLERFYTALRACVRARLAAAHLLEPTPSSSRDWLAVARDYLARAQRLGSALA
ncbi:MAG TPA: hypothetical protein VMG60_21840 [Burkholderiaceae bacterium]|nr:hypothetical protein [Burkholderiaceae bacterium]